jgi:predicted ATPase/DNA-binding SARP family transcriptional activator
MPRLMLTLLGSPRIALDGEPLTFAYQKVAALLIYLAVESQRPHARIALAALLWPEAPERVARQSLSQALTTLRAALGERTTPQDRPPLLLVDAATVQLNPAADWELDLGRFRALDAEIQAHRRHSPRACAPCAERLAQIAAVYQGDFLDQFSLRDSALFEEWALVQRAQLREVALGALEQLADIAEWRAQYGRAIDYTRRQIVLEPLREGSHRVLMRLLALSGQPAAALAHYEQLCRALAREMGVAPEEPTVALRDHIRAAALTSGAPRRYQPPFARVPARPAPLIGRATELDALSRSFLFDRQRLITIVGPPGIGKTSLAQVAAAGARFDFVDGVAFVELAPLADAALIPAAIARALEIAESPGKDLTATLTATLSERHMLLTLDNFEQLLDGAPLVATLLESCPALAVLVTSRTPLGIRGEHLYPLDTLTLPQPDADMAAISRATAVQLFVDRARAARPDFTLTPDNAATVAAICARLDGLPLAIELIVAQAESLAPDELLCRLDSSLATLVDGPRDLPERQQTMRNAIRWSFDLLGAQEQRVFACLGVFAGGCTAEALGEILADQQIAAAVLPNLQRASLVRLQASHEQQRYLMLETIRAYTREILDATQTIDEARTRHAGYYARLVGCPTSRVAQLLAEHENLLAALAWVIARDLPATTLQLGIGLAQIWVRNRSWVNGLLWLETLFARQAAAPPCAARLSRDDAQPSDAKLEMGQQFSILHSQFSISERYPHLQAWVERQLLCAEQQGDAELQRLAQLALALVCQAQGRYHETQQLFEAALAGPARAADRFPLVLLAELYARTQQFEQAYALYTTCVRLNRACGDTEGMADALAGLAQIADLRRALSDAATFGQEALELYESIEHQHGIARMLCIIGSISYGRGAPMPAVAQYCRSFAICHQLHDTAGCADVFEALAPILAELEYTDLVVRAISAAAALRGSDGTHLTLAEQARLDVLLEQCAAQLGRPALERLWQQAHSVSGEQLLALIEDVRLLNDEP